jgi:hypothetical protein
MTMKNETLSKMTLRTVDTVMLSVINKPVMLSVIMLSAVMLNVKYKPDVLSVIMQRLRVVMLSVVVHLIRYSLLDKGVP